MASVRFSRPLKIWFYAIWGVLFVTGIVWLVINFFVPAQDDFDSVFIGIKTWLMRSHGAAAMAVLVLFGYLMPQHMMRAWAQQRNRVTAVVVVALSVIFILSGFGLYYSGSESMRAGMSNVHSLAGIIFPFALMWHIYKGRRRK